MAEASRVTGNQTQIFISHARVDARYAGQVERALTTWRLFPWVDRQQLAGGQEWPVKLQQAIDQSAAVIVVLTPAALASPMVHREFQYAQRRGIPVIVLHFKPVATLPPELASVPAITYHGNPQRIGTAFYTLLEDLHLLPPPRDDQLGALEPADGFHHFAHRLPSSWYALTLPKAVSWRIIGTFWAVVAAVGVGTNVLVSVLLPMLGLPMLGVFVAFLPVLLVVLLLVSLPLWFMMAMQLNIVLGRVPQDRIILAPDHCTVQILTLERMRITTLPLRYPYHLVKDATWHVDRRRRVIVTLTPVAGAALMRIVIPRRWANRRSVAAEIVVAITTYRQAHPLEAAHGAPAAPKAAPMVTAQTMTRPTYCLLAAATDQALLQVLQPWLAARGFLPDEPVLSGGFLLPTAMGAALSRFILVVTTPAVMSSPQCSATITDLQRQGKLVIPIRTDGALALPEHFAPVQWVDFGPGIDRARSFLDLCDTLDRANALPPLPGGQFDAELALARAIHEHIPAEWYAYKPDTSEQRRYRMQQISSLLTAWLVPLGLGVLLVAAATPQVQATYATNDPFSATVIAGVTILLVAGFFASVLWRMRPALAAFGFLGRLLRGSSAPECVVITPEGIAFHVVATNRSRFVDGGYAFATLQLVTVQHGLLGVPKLRLLPRYGKPMVVPLTNFGSFMDTIITQAQAAWEKWGSEAVHG